MGESSVSDYGFNERLNFGHGGEVMVVENFSTILRPLVVEYLFGKCAEHTKKQLNGIDFSIPYKNFEIKTREFKYYKYKDIVLETVSKIETNKLGWFYTSTADVIIYLWLTENRTKIQDAYLLILEELRKYEIELMVDWFDKTVRRTTSTNGGQWHTEWFAPPISAFPENTIIHVNPADLNNIYGKA
jgi:hypothetical protein